MRDDVGKAWDGFDKRACVYDERKEKKWQAGVWKVLACVMVFMILYLLTDQVKEFRLMQKGNMVEATYDGKSRLARFWDDAGQFHIVDLSGYFPICEGSLVRLYYEEDPARARPQNSLASKLACYGFFGGLLGICVWRLRKIY